MSIPPTPAIPPPPNLTSQATQFHPHPQFLNPQTLPHKQHNSTHTHNSSTPKPYLTSNTIPPTHHILTLHTVLNCHTTPRTKSPVKLLHKSQSTACFIHQICSAAAICFRGQWGTGFVNNFFSVFRRNFLHISGAVWLCSADTVALCCTICVQCSLIVLCWYSSFVLHSLCPVQSDCAQLIQWLCAAQFVPSAVWLCSADTVALCCTILSSAVWLCSGDTVALCCTICVQCSLMVLSWCTISVAHAL